MSYWILEFIRVGIGYIFLMYLWPSVVFRKHLSGKSLTYRFAFCSTVSVILINTLVLSLGLFHILDGRIVFFLFFGIFIASILKEKRLRLRVSGQRLQLLLEDAFPQESPYHAGEHQHRRGAAPVLPNQLHLDRSS